VRRGDDALLRRFYGDVRYSLSSYIDILHLVDSAVNIVRSVCLVAKSNYVSVRGSQTGFLSLKALCTFLLFPSLLSLYSSDRTTFLHNAAYTSLLSSYREYRS
jgi:hypothetical protein